MANRDQKIEAIVESIGLLHGCWQDPESDAYQLKSPLLLRSFARAGKHEVDEQGRRVFPSMLSGFKAATFDVSLKLEGTSRAGLKPETDTLLNLLRVYGITEGLAHKKAVNFLRKSLKDPSISLETKLSFFLSADLPVQLIEDRKSTRL